MFNIQINIFKTVISSAKQLEILTEAFWGAIATNSCTNKWLIKDTLLCPFSLVSKRNVILIFGNSEY